MTLSRAVTPPPLPEVKDHSWGPWYHCPSAPGIDARVRRSLPPPGTGGIIWLFQFSNRRGGRAVIRWKVGMGPGDAWAPHDCPLEVDEIFTGMVQLPTAGPVWVDAVVGE